MFQPLCVGLVRTLGELSSAEATALRAEVSAAQSLPWVTRCLSSNVTQRMCRMILSAVFMSEYKDAT